MPVDYSNPSPHEVLAGPFTAYFAPVGTAFPAVGEAPGGSWTILGSGGNLNYSDEGIATQHGQTINYFTPLGSTIPTKAFRPDETHVIKLTLVDMTLDEYRTAMNWNEKTNDDGFESISFKRGFEVRQRAMLLIGPNPLGDELQRQIRYHAVVQSGNPEPIYRKGEPAMLALEFTALADDSGEPGGIYDEEAAT